jgi:hypothetical protein
MISDYNHVVSRRIQPTEGAMGRPIGSINREKPFTDALRIALRSNPLTTTAALIGLMFVRALALPFALPSAAVPCRV